MSQGPARSGKVVSSRQNPLVAEIRRLERDRRAREAKGVYLAWGLHLAAEALTSGVAIERALVTEALEKGAEGRGLAARLAQARVPVVRVTERVLDAISEGAGDQGLLLLLRRPADTLETVVSRGATLVLAAYGVQDPGNLGSMARTALASGAGALLALEGSADPFASRTVRAGMGAHGRLPILAARAGTALGVLRDAGFFIVAADPGGARRPEDVDLTRPTALLVGNEGGGLPPEILAAAHERVRIPMSARASSLNVHAAAAILLYETQRQRAFAGLR